VMCASAPHRSSRGARALVEMLRHLRHCVTRSCRIVTLYPDVPPSPVG
jgi:hypothetical protein